MHDMFLYIHRVGLDNGLDLRRSGCHQRAGVGSSRGDVRNAEAHSDEEGRGQRCSYGSVADDERHDAAVGLLAGRERRVLVGFLLGYGLGGRELEGGCQLATLKHEEHVPVVGKLVVDLVRAEVVGQRSLLLEARGAVHKQLQQ